MIGFEIQHDDAVLFQQRAVHDALQQHPLPLQAVTVMTAVVEDGELEFPQAWASGAKLPADFRIEKRRDFPAVRQFSLFLGDEFLRNQTGNFLLLLCPLLPQFS